MPVPVYKYPPPNLANEDIFEFFKKEIWPVGPTREITLDFRKLKFIAPWAVCLYGAYVSWMREQHQCSVRIKANPTTVAGSYVVRSGLPELAGDSTHVVADATIPPNAKTIQLSGITQSAGIQPFITKVMHLLGIDDQEMAGATRYSIVELVRNAVQHSQSATGGTVMAQFYPRPGEVDVIVADMGKGIKATLTNKHNGTIKSDTEALNEAVRAHISGTYEPKVYSAMRDNAGLGLFIVKEMAALSGGRFTLASGDALLHVHGGEKGNLKQELHHSGEGGWPGTFAMLQLSKGNIGNFNNLLSTCRELAQKIRANPLEFSLNFIENIPDKGDILNIRVGDFEENVEEAARVRDEIIIPALARKRLVVLDFSNIPFATQSFVHALFYKLFRDHERQMSSLQLAKCTKATREAIRFVADYARDKGPAER